jgi:hypothetical protein
VAELENALTVKDRMLTQSEQRQRELGKNLEQAKNSKDKLNSELSTQAALVADLQKRLETIICDLGRIPQLSENATTLAYKTGVV